MRKTKLVILALVITMVLSSGMVFADTSAGTINLTVGQSAAQVNGQAVTMSAPAVVVSGRALVPFRFIGEALGCDVNWEPTTKTATLTLEKQTIEIPIGQTYVMINGEKITVEVPGQLINGSTYVPLRFIGENLGAKVDYDPATKGISILLNTYQSEAQKLAVVFPDGWTVTADTAEGVTLTDGTNQATFSSEENLDQAVTLENFDAFAEEAMKEFASKDQFQYYIDEDGLVTGSYVEDGVLLLIGYKLLDNGIGTFVGGIDANSDLDSFVNNCSLMVNTFIGITE